MGLSTCYPLFVLPPPTPAVFPSSSHNFLLLVNSLSDKTQSTVIAQTLAANGAKVYITGRRADVLETSARVHGAQSALDNSGGDIIPVVMDVTNKKDIEQVVAKIKAEEDYVNV